jgi:uncharacterized protein (TIGR03545 family)
MRKWLRWQGLLAFLGVVVVLSALWLILVDGIVKRMIEKTGTQVVGARVEVGAADVSLFPLGLRLTRLQVTNPDKPMTNAVEIAEIALSVDPLNLLLRKVLIEKMTLAGVRLNTPRKTSGAIAERPVSATALKKKLAEKFELPSLEIRDVREILRKEELESLKLIASVRADIDAGKEKWQKRLAELPDKKKLKEYKKRIKKLKLKKKDGLFGILGGVSEIMEIRRELEQKINLIRTARADLDRELKLLQKRLKEAEKAPQNDIRRLKQKYSLSPEGLANLSRMLFAGKIAEWMEKTFVWYGRLRPFLERSGERKDGTDTEVVKPLRGRGVNVRFKEYRPLPDFLIRTTQAAIEMPAGAITGQIRNITPDQDILGMPLTFAFSGEGIKHIQSLKLDGKLDHIVPTSAKDTLNIRIRGFELRDITLSDSKQWPVSLQKGLADLDLQATLSGEALAARLAAKLVVELKSVKIAPGKQTDSKPAARVIGDALSGVSRFNLGADISGTLADYDIRLTSDLDRVLKNAVENMVRKQAARLEKDLSSAINKKVSGPLKDLKSGFGGLAAIDADLADRLSRVSGLF